MSKIKPPKSFKQYFWDVDFEKLDVKKNYFLIIKRVLDRGKTDDIKWLLKNYGKKKIEEVLMGSKDISRPAGYFWANLLGLDINKLPCLQKPYSPIHFGLFS